MRLLIVVAHPDDELTMAGTIARVVAEGARVTVVCATAGAGGGDCAQDPWALMERRQAELEASAVVLGIECVVHLETPRLGEPPLRRGSYAAVMEDQARHIAVLIDVWRPDVVVSFGPDGITGHQTHIDVGRVTSQAVQASGLSPAEYAVAFGPDQTEAVKTWLRAHPECLLGYQAALERNPALGPPVPAFNEVPRASLTCEIDVAPWWSQKLAAAACHVSQGGGGGVLDAFCAPRTEAFVHVRGPLAPVGSAFRGDHA